MRVPLTERRTSSASRPSISHASFMFHFNLYLAHVLCFWFLQDQVWHPCRSGKFGANWYGFLGGDFILPFFFLLQRVFVNRLTLFLSQLDCSVCAFFPSNLREGNRLSAEGSNVTGCGKRVRRRPSNGCTHWRLVSARDREECRDASARPFASVAGGSAAEADTCHTSCR